MTTPAPPRPNRLLVLVGPAGAGKTTLAHRLIEQRPGRLAFSVSHTTRAIRAGEVDGRDYHFVDREAFAAMVRQDAFVESAEVHGQLYGTSAGEVARLTAQGKDIVFDIDIQGAHAVWRRYPNATTLCFVLPPSWRELVDRLTARGSETEATIRRRLTTARRELRTVVDSSAPWHIIVNDALHEACRQIADLLDGVDGPAARPGEHPGVQAFLRDADADPRANAAA